MSYCYIYGIMPVSEGRRVQTVRANGSTVWHALYDSMFPLESGGQLDGTLRAFSPASESTFTSESLVLVHAKFAVPPNQATVTTPEFVAESISSNVFYGDPSDDNYDSFLPAENTTVISLLGNVVGAVVHMGDGGKAVDVRVSTFIQNKTLECNYRIRFPPTARWSKLNMPMAGSVIAVSGRPYSMSGADGGGLLVITVEDIVYNPGTTHILADPRADQSISPRRLQVKKRKRTSAFATDVPDFVNDVFSVANEPASVGDPILPNAEASESTPSPKKRARTATKKPAVKSATAAARSTTAAVRAAAKRANAKVISEEELTELEDEGESQAPTVDVETVTHAAATS